MKGICCKRVLLWILKAILGGGIALISASLICLLYYNPGIHTTNETEATDYIWQSNHFTSRITEGIAWKKTDENGFLSNVISSDDIDVLIMGSSHMEAAMLFDNKTVTGLLNDMLDMSVYNIGTSGHTLLVCVGNLEAALNVYAPSEYVIMETGRTLFSDLEIREVLEQNFPEILSYDTGILYQLQKIPYLKLAYKQYKSINGVSDVEDEKENDDNSSITLESYNALMAYISEICEAHDVQPIIFYHPSLVLAWDGSVSSNADEESLLLFQTACEENGIVFVDMTQDFIDMYYDDHVLPTGFCNTAVGTGHMNQYGHRAVAERLAAVITELKESGEVVAS